MKLEEAFKLKQRLLATRDYAEAVIEAVSPLLVLDPELRVLTANASFCKCFRISSAQALNRRVYELGDGQWNIPKLRTMVRSLLEISAEVIGGDSVRVWFKDSGIGITPENHRRVFRLFERVHPVAEYEGTGIGLTMRKATERMGAQVGFKSALGKGSHFWIQLKKA